jgi:hypothetical protein
MQQHRRAKAVCCSSAAPVPQRANMDAWMPWGKSGAPRCQAQTQLHTQCLNDAEATGYCHISHEYDHAWVAAHSVLSDCGRLWPSEWPAPKHARQHEQGVQGMRHALWCPVIWAVNKNPQLHLRSRCCNVSRSGHSAAGGLAQVRAQARFLLPCPVLSPSAACAVHHCSPSQRT